MNILMAIHIAGGLLALPAGTVAVAARKGGRLHARAGTCSSARCSCSASPPRSSSRSGTPEPGSPLGGIIVCYFVATSWVAARRRDGTTGRFEIARLRGRARHGRADGLGRGSCSGATTPAGPGAGLRRRRHLPARRPARSQRDPAREAHARAADRAPPLADVLRLLHRDRLLLPRPAGRAARGGPRLAGPVRPGLRAVRGDGLLAGPGAVRESGSRGLQLGSAPLAWESMLCEREGNRNAPRFRRSGSG